MSGLLFLTVRRGTCRSGGRQCDGTVRGQTRRHTESPSIEASAAPGLSGDDEADVYLAPETAQGGIVPEKLDIFSLGAVGYRLFSGQPPASTVAALNERLASAGGLRLSDAIDGLPGSLQLVVESATDPEVGKRPDTVSEFLDLLVEAEHELAEMREEQEAVVHPLDANPGDRLEHGFRVERRLGRGSTAIALKVQHEDGDGVLKVALDTSLNERIRREGKVLGLLRHPNVVPFHRRVELSGHTALFIAMAGTENKTGTYTLADRIREEGRLSLDLLERFGRQLLSVVQWLEDIRDLASGSEARQHRGIHEQRGQVARPRRVRLLARGRPSGEHPGGHSSVPGSVPSAAPTPALGRLRGAFRGGDDAPRDGDRKPASMGRRFDRPRADRRRSHRRRRVVRSGSAGPARCILRQGAGQGLPGTLRQRRGDAPRMVRVLPGDRPSDCGR